VSRVCPPILLVAIWSLIPTVLPADQVDYLTQIKPLLTEKCYSCHGALTQESDLRLETRTLMLEGGDSGAVIVPGNPAESILLERIGEADEDLRMPPAEEGSPLQPDQIALIRDWIEQGADAPLEQLPPAPGEHWAFQRIVRPQIPAHVSRASLSNPIDLLLESKRATQGLRAQGEAPRPILIRRLYLDLIGLSPTRRQLADERPWQTIVDELLANPQHGERWARHWMDIWRYSDWHGLGSQLRYSQKHIWRWRDWIVDSLNQDKGYDRMVLEMLAGDELAPDDPTVVVATGFLARNYYLFNRTTWLDNTIEHTSKAFLGLTTNCAKCHDHKYDPITHIDYYRFRAIFEPHQVRLDPIPGVSDFEQDGLPRVFDDQVDAVTYLHRKGDPKNPDKELEINPGVPAILASFAPAIEAIDLPASAYAPGSRPYVQRDRLQLAVSEVAASEQQLAEAQQQLAEMPQQQSSAEARSPDFEITEQFDSPNPQVWTVIGDGWQYRDGALHQTVSTREAEMVRLVDPVPRDFELRCRYTTTGGSIYKSVTFRFDQSEDAKFENFVYSSAQAPGPKIHVAFTRQGKTTYPPQGRRSQEIEIGRQYELRFAVRDTLVNVWLDGKFMVAYRLPDRGNGFLSLSAFDATAAFDSITIRSLSDDTELAEAGNKVIASVGDAEQAVKVAETKLAAAHAGVRSIEATIAADNGRFHGAGGARDARQLAKAAGRRQLELQIAEANHQMLADAADDKKVQAAKQRLETASDKLRALDEDTEDAFEYEPIRGARKALETPAHKEQDYPATYSATSTGRRSALGKWIGSRENPLTARVAVNHVWTRHFGTPLVESVFDFGLRSKRPLHAELLDLLAVELMDSDWSLQHLHRLIVTSRAYRMSSSAKDVDASTVAADPTNQYYWRMNARRMESQVVRDCLLGLAGQLESTVGGRSLDPGSVTSRRSLYFTHSVDQRDKFLVMFDDADTLQCYRRTESIVPQQALALSNSKLAFDMSEKIAERLSAAQADSSREAFIGEVYYLLLGRFPSAAEAHECDRFFKEMESLPERPQSAAPRQRIRARFVQAILNHNDFITIR
jgi:hypothetical protein